MENQLFYRRWPLRGHGGAMGFKRFGARGPRVAKTAQNHAWDLQVFTQEGAQAS